VQATADRPVAPPDPEERAPMTDRVGRPRWGRELAVVTVLASLVSAVVYRVWDRTLSMPLVHAGDFLPHVALLDTVGWTGTPAPNPQLGAPAGLDWSAMPSGADRAHLIVLRILRALSGDSVVAANLYLLAAIVLVSVVAFVVLRSLQLSAVTSTVMAIVFAVAPAQLARASVGHLFLAAYVSVPIGVWLALWASGAQGIGRAGGGRTAVRSWWVPAALVVLVGSASAYYAAFAAVGVLTVGALVALRRGAWRDLLRPVLVAGGIVATVVVNVAGEVLARGATEAGVRVPLDVDAYGLRISQMLLPVRNHRVGALAELTEGAFRVDAPGDVGAALGLISTIGLLAIVVCCIRRVGRPQGDPDLLSGPVEAREGVVARLGVLALGAIAFAAVGGISMVLATVGLTQIRAWSRMASVVGFVGVAGAAMLMDAAFRRCSPSAIGRGAIGALVVVFAVLDQTTTASLPSERYNAERWDADVAVAADLEAALPEGSLVFQLPVGAFPAELPMGSVGANELLGPYVAGTGRLSWTTGAFTGSPGDWQRSIAARPTEELVDLLAAGDVAALSVDRRAFDDEATATSLEREVRAVVGPPAFESADGTRAWYDLRPRRAELVDEWGAATVERVGAAATRPVSVVVEGSPGVRALAETRSRALEASSAIVLRDHGDVGGPVTVGFELAGEPGAVVQVRAPSGTTSVTLRDEPVPVELSVDLAPGRPTRVELVTDAAALDGPLSAWGDLRLRLTELSVDDPVAVLPGA
jgi:phosphoglycerol transferase